MAVLSSQQQDQLSSVIVGWQLLPLSSSACPRSTFPAGALHLASEQCLAQCYWATLRFCQIWGHFMSSESVVSKNISEGPYGGYWFLFPFFLSFFFLKGPQAPHMEVPGLGVELELQPPAHAIATAMQDLSCVCDLHHSSGQCQIPNPLSGARDWTCLLMVTSQVRYHWATVGTLISCCYIRCTL